MIKYYATLFLFLLLMGLWLMGAASSHQEHRESVFSHPNKISSFRIGKRRPLDANELAEFQALFNQGAFVKGLYNFIPTRSHSGSNSSEIDGEMGELRANRKKVRILAWYNPIDNVLYISDDDYDDYGNGLLISNVPPSLVRYDDSTQEEGVSTDGDAE